VIWLRFGLLFLLFIKAATLFGSLRTRFPGGVRVDGKEGFEAKVSRGKNRKLESVCLGLDLSDRVRFIMRREGMFDRIAKWVGIAREWQTRDSAFDDTVFVICDDPVLLDDISADAKLRAAVEQLLKRPSIKSLHCADGTVWIVMTKFDDAWRELDDDYLALAVKQSVGTDLIEVRERLQEVRAAPWTSDRDPVAARQQVLLAVSFVIGVAGIAAFLWSLGSGLPIQIVYDAIERRSLVVTAIVAAIFLGVLVTMIGRTSRTHLVLLEIVFVALPGAWFISRGVLTLENQRADSSQRLEHVTPLVDVYMQRGRRSTSYYLVVESWPDPRMESTKLQVDASVYREFRRDDCAKFTLRNGLYGDLWLESIVKVDCQVGGSAAY